MAMNFPIRYFPAFNVVLYALTGRDSYSWKMAGNMLPFIAVFWKIKFLKA